MNKDKTFRTSITFFLFSIIIILKAESEITESNHIPKNHMLYSKIDSLQQQMQLINQELQQLKLSMPKRKFSKRRSHTATNTKCPEQCDVGRKGRINYLLNDLSIEQEYLQFKSSATTILQNAGKKRTMAVASFNIYTFASLSANSLMFFDFEAVGGDGPDKFYPNFAGSNGDAGSNQDEDGIDRLNVLEAWIEMKMLNEKITLTTGKIDLTNYFDINLLANDENMQFISGSFVNSSAFVVPSNSPGMRIHGCMNDHFYFQLGLASMDNSGDDIFKEIYRIMNVGWVLSPESNFETNVRLYGYQIPLDRNVYGWGISIDKNFQNLLQIFGRYGNNENALSREWEIQNAWSVGTNIKLNTMTIGLAVGVNNAYKTVLNNEKVLEVYASHQLKNNIFISPHFQRFWNVNGSERNITLLGARMHFDF